MQKICHLQLIVIWCSTNAKGPLSIVSSYKFYILGKKFHDIKTKCWKMIKSHNEISTWYQKRIQIMLTLFIFVLRIEQKEGDWMKLEKDVTAYGYHELLSETVMFLFIPVSLDS